MLARDVALDRLGGKVGAVREGGAQPRGRPTRRERARQRHEVDQFGVAALDDPRAELPGDAGDEQAHQSALTKRS